MNAPDAENFFKATCTSCGVNAEVPNELYDQSVNCPQCQNSFLARPNEKIEQPRKSISHIIEFTARAPVGLTCPFCKSPAISPGAMSHTAVGTLVMIIGIVLIFVFIVSAVVALDILTIFAIAALVGLLCVSLSFGMREMKYTCQNCRKTF